MDTIVIDGVELHLSPPTEFPAKWIGQRGVQEQLIAAWLKLQDDDIPLTPRVIGPPGVGKTTMAYTTAKELGKETYFMQATMDTRPEDLIITPVISDDQKIKYVASPIVSAMIRGGTVILDEGNRMAEKSWASLAPLLDQRRYVESQIAGITIKAHEDFRLVTTMNSDASTFELPEYITSRLQPVIELDYPTSEEERAILKYNIPFAPDEIIDQVVAFLQAAHYDDKPYTVRGGIQVLSFSLKLKEVTKAPIENCLMNAVLQVFGDDAMEYI